MAKTEMDIQDRIMCMQVDQTGRAHWRTEVSEDTKRADIGDRTFLTGLLLCGVDAR